MKWIDDILDVGSAVVIWLSIITAGLFSVLMAIPLILKVMYDTIREENKEVDKRNGRYGNG